MVYGQRVEGYPKEVAAQIAQLPGNRRVSVMVEEAEAACSAPRLTEAEFAQEMDALQALAVSVEHFVDDSREAIYTRQEGE